MSKINEKDKALFANEAKLNELALKVTELMAEKSNLSNVKSTAEDERDKHDKIVLELKAQVENLNMTLKTKETEMGRALDKIVELEKRVCEWQKEEENSGCSGFKGYTEMDTLKAIEDVVKLQGKSMSVMTESFKAVVQEVKELREDLVKSKIGRNGMSVTQVQPISISRVSYAEALIKRNSTSIRSRNVIINDREDYELINEIKKVATFNSLSIDT